MKTGAISNHPYAHNIRSMKYSEYKVVLLVDKAKNALDLPKLIDSLKKLAKSDPIV